MPARKIAPENRRHWLAPRPVEGALEKPPEKSQPAERLTVEIEASALQRLMARGQLAAADFRCQRRCDKARVKRWCLEHASRSLQ